MRGWSDFMGVGECEVMWLDVAGQCGAVWGERVQPWTVDGSG